MLLRGRSWVLQPRRLAEQEAIGYTPNVAARFVDCVPYPECESEHYAYCLSQHRLEKKGHLDTPSLEKGFVSYVLRLRLSILTHTAATNSYSHADQMDCALFAT